MGPLDIKNCYIAQRSESKASYYAPKYMEAQAANDNARVQSEIDEATRRMIDVEQQLLAAQNTNEDVTSLKEELVMLQSERRTKRESLVFRPMKKNLPQVMIFEEYRHRIQPLVIRSIDYESIR